MAPGAAGFVGLNKHCACRTHFGVLHRRNRTAGVILGLVPRIHRGTYSVRSRVCDAMGSYWTYILASEPRGTLYIGVTNRLIFRVEQHRAGKGSAFTRKYRVHMLV